MIRVGKPTNRKTIFGSVPVRNSCPANNNGYGQHETDASTSFHTAYDSGMQVESYPCKHCSALFAVTYFFGADI